MRWTRCSFGTRYLHEAVLPSVETESEDEEVSKAVCMCVCLVNASVGMSNTSQLFCVQEFPPVKITDKTGKILDEKCKTSVCTM